MPEAEAALPLAALTKEAMSQYTQDGRWCVEFWDHGAWNEMAGTRRRHKAECIALAQAFNKRDNPQRKDSAFEGHRYRVRRVKT